MKNAVINKIPFEISKKMPASVNRIALKAAKYSPQLCFGAGCLGLVSVGVLGYRCGKKAAKRISEYKEWLDSIETKDSVDDYTQEERLEVGKKTVKMVLGVALDILPAIVAGGLTILCFAYGQHTLAMRLNAATNALMATTSAFSSYRSAVEKEMGEDKAKSLSAAEKAVQVTPGEQTDETYSRFFDESSVFWRKSAADNKAFCLQQQAVANELLKSRGHLFLNEVYDLLDLQRSKIGQFVGWVVKAGEEPFIDFGIFDGSTLAKRKFVNEMERNVLLNFNVQGVIYDMI